MAEKTNKNMIIGIAVAVVVVLAIIIGVIVVKNNSGDEPDGDTDTGQVEEDGLDGVDLSKVDLKIGEGDYDKMLTLSKSIQNGEMNGQVVRIDGVVSHPMSRYLIGEKDEDDSFVGTEFVIEGLSEDAYPEDGTRAIITGVVVEKAALYYVIKTTPEYVEILEEDIETEEEPVDGDLDADADEYDEAEIELPEL